MNPKIRLISLFLLTHGLLFTAPGNGAPQITIKSRTVISITTKPLKNRYIEIRARLYDIDEDSNKGIPNKLIFLTTSNDQQDSVFRKTTNTQGWATFRIHTSLDTRTTLRLHFKGDRLYHWTTYGPIRIDVSKASHSFSIRAAKQLSLKKERHPIFLDIDQPLALLSPKMFRLYIDGQQIPAALKKKPLPALWVKSSDLGKTPRAIKIEVKLAENSIYNGANASINSYTALPSRIELVSPPKSHSLNLKLKLKGKAFKANDLFIGQMVHLFSQEQLIFSTQTNEKGEFNFEVPAYYFTPGTYSLFADLPSSDLRWMSAQSHAFTLKITKAPTSKAFYYLLPASITFSLLLFLFVGRLIYLRRKIRHDLPVTPKRSNSLSEQIPKIEKPLILTTKRQRRPQFKISGTIIDAVDRVILSADVELKSQTTNSQHILQANTGDFRFDSLERGKIELCISKEGYIPQTISIEIPHYGQYHQFQIALLPIRVKILQLYRRVAIKALPKSALWARWTPKELLRFLAEEKNEDIKITSLSELVEEAYWSCQPPNMNMLTQAEKIVDAIKR